MHFGVRSDRIPTMYTYSEAVARFDSIKPYSKGKYKGQKPLAERSRRYLRIGMEESGDRLGQKVVITMYNTDIVTYMPDGRILIDQNTYNTATTHTVIAKILDSFLFTRHKTGWIQCANGVFALRVIGANVFVRSSNGELKFVNPVQPIKHKLKVKELNKLRKKYKAFEAYGVALIKLQESCEFNLETFMQAYGRSPRHADFECHTLCDLMASDNPNGDEWFKAVLGIQHACVWWRGRENHVAEFKRMMYETIKLHHKEELFEKIPAELGRVTRDSNGRFFPAWA